MTSRLLLTLLALLTGFSAQGGAVQARAIPGTVHVAAASTLATVQYAKAEALMARPAPEADNGRFTVFLIPLMVQPQAHAPAFLTQIDRAHE